MANIYVDLEDTYKPKTTSEKIEVSVQIGDAGDEVGAYMIFLGLKLKGANKPATLGKASDVIGKAALISATVPDELEETNWTSFKVVFKEGNSTTEFGPYKKLVPTHLDVVCYTLRILISDED